MADANDGMRETQELLRRSLSVLHPVLDGAAWSDVNRRAAAFWNAAWDRVNELQQKLLDARYLGDNHHNAAECPYCGDLLRNAEGERDGLRSNVEAARAILAPYAKHPSEPLIVMAEHARDAVEEARNG